MKNNVQPLDWDAVIDRLKQGWTKVQRHDRNGGVCIVGAIEDVCQQPDSGYELTAGSSLPGIIRDQFPERVPHDDALINCVAYMFNDHKDTTLDDVILVCEKARARSAEL